MINIEKIMNEIREETGKDDYEDDVLAFDDVLIDLKEVLYGIEWDYDNILASFSHIENLHWDREPEGNVFVKAIKKVIKKSVNFLIAPIVSEKIQLNQLYIQSLYQIEEYMYKQNELLDVYQTHLAALEKRLSEIDMNNLGDNT